MLYAFIPVRLHGILDEVVAALYLVGAYLLGLQGVAFGGAGVHFLLTRFTDYPEGTWKVIPFRVHAFIELGEGVAAFGFSDYGPRRRA